MKRLEFDDLTPETFLKMYYEDKQSVPKLAKKYKVHPGTLYRRAQQWGLKLKDDKDYTGHKFSHFVVIGPGPRLSDKKHTHHRRTWICKCDCGNEKILTTSQINNPEITRKSCGCHKHDAAKERKEKNRLARVKNFKNRKFGQLTALELVGFDALNQPSWLCKCKCGTEKKISQNYLDRKIVTCCGCSKIKNSGFSYGEVSYNYYYRVKKGAATRDIEFNIVPKDIWNQYIQQNKKCALSGIKIEFGKLNDKYKVIGQTASVDRIDNSKGYIEGNIQIVHKDINRMRGKLSVKKFKEWCKLITENSNE